MFYVKEIKGDIYSVVDTTDGSVDNCTLAEIKGYQKMGIYIEGVRKPLGDVMEKYKLLIDLDGHTMGVDQYGEVTGFFNNGTQLYSGRVRYQAKTLRLLSKHRITQTGYVVCIEEVKAFKDRPKKYLKSYIYYIDIAKQVIKLIDSMDDFCEGVHVIAKPSNDGIQYGRKVISRQSLLSLVS